MVVAVSGVPPALEVLDDVRLGSSSDSKVSTSLQVDRDEHGMRLSEAEPGNGLRVRHQSSAGNNPKYSNTETRLSFEAKCFCYCRRLSV